MTYDDDFISNNLNLRSTKMPKGNDTSKAGAIKHIASIGEEMECYA